MALIVFIVLIVHLAFYLNLYMILHIFYLMTLSRSKIILCYKMYANFLFLLNLRNYEKLVKIYLIHYNLNCVGFYGPEFIYERRIIPKQISLTNEENNLDNTQSNNIISWGSPNSTKSTQLHIVDKYFEQGKSEELEDSMAVTKAKHSRLNTHLRKDVVNKSIVRALNRFYNRRFQFRIYFNGHAKDFEQSISYKKLKNLIILSTGYQEYFSMINEEGSKSKLIIILWLFAVKFWNENFH